jgi:hypothetical protein
MARYTVAAEERRFVPSDGLGPRTRSIAGELEPAGIVHAVDRNGAVVCGTRVFLHPFPEHDFGVGLLHRCPKCKTVAGIS